MKFLCGKSPAEQFACWITFGMRRVTHELHMKVGNERNVL